MFSHIQKIYGEKNTKVIMIFSGWSMQQWQLWLLGQLFNSYGFKTIIFTWDRSILTTDPQLTLERFDELKKKTVEIINQLPKRQQQHLSFFGLTNGAELALLVANQLPRLENLILNVAGADLAEIVWTGNSAFPELKKGFRRKKITLKILKETWYTLSPINNLENLKTKRALIYLAAHDEIVPFAEQERLVQEFRQHKISTSAIINTRHHHRLSTLINLLKFDIYMSFLKGGKPDLLRSNRS